MSLFKDFSRTLGGRALPASFYLFVFLFYSITLDMGGNVMVMRLLYALYYGLSFYYIVKVHMEGHLPKYIKILDLFVFVIFLYVLADIVIKGLTSIGAYGNTDFMWWHIQSVLPIYSFYYFGKKNLISDDWFLFVFVFCFIAVYISYQTYYQKQLANDIWNQTEFTNNVGYEFVALLPITMFFSKKKIVQYVCIGAVAVYTILSFKRGAMLCLGVSLLLFLFHEMHDNRRKKGTKRFGVVVLGIVGVVMLYLFVVNLLGTSEYFNERIDQTSGDDSRSMMYKYYWNAYINGDFFQIVFGRGVLASFNQFGSEAHNDWLEYAIDLGLVGIIFYFVYCKTLVREYFKSKKKSEQNVEMALGVVVIIFLIRTVFSMSFYDMSFYLCMALGYCVAKSNKQQI